MPKFLNKPTDSEGNVLSTEKYVNESINTVNTNTENTYAKKDDIPTNYAGSSTAGGSATSAVKLDSSAGSATQPVYFSNGKPVKTTYTLGKSVPSNAVFTDTVYTHPSYTAQDSGLYKVTVDSTGHVSSVEEVVKSDITALGIPASDTNTHYTSKNVVNSSNTATSNTTTALTNGNVYLISVENGAVTSAHKITGSGATTVTTDASGNIVISSTYNAATTSSNGLMTSAMVTKLNGITDSADSVSFSRSLTSGTKVGTITINGTGTDLYAPTNTDTHYTTGLKVGASSTATANAAATNGNVYLNALDNTTVRDSHKITGSGATTVTSDANGVITISSTDTKYTSLKNPYALTIQGNGKTLTNGTYDGSAAKTVNITPSSIGAAASSHTHSYLPLSGGAISSSNFGPLTIERSGSTNGAAIYFKNSNGILGSIGMTNSVNSGLQRWGYGTDTHMYTVLDTGNAFTTTAPKANGTAAAGSATTVSRSDHVHPLQTSVSGSSGSCTGNAATATALTTSAGSATQPVYFSNGKPVKTTYTLGKSVPSNAVFTDTKYTHPTTSGNKHIPSGGSSGQILRWSADGTAAWGSDNNTDTKVTSAAVNPSSATTYYPTLVTGATTGTVSYNTDLSTSILQGTASAEGYAVLKLGNDTAAGTAGNKRGQINLYSSSTACSYIRQADITSAITHTFPATGGTVLNSGTTSFTPSITSGSRSGVLKINGNSYNIYFTDTKVTQTNTTASSAYRLLMSYNANDTTQTVGARKSAKFTANPSTGCLTASMFKGVYSTIYSGTISKSSGTITISNLWNYSILFVSIVNIDGSLAEVDRYPIAVQNLNASTSNMEVIHFFESDGTYSTSTSNFIRFKKSSTANSIDITTEGITRIGMIEIEAFL